MGVRGYREWCAEVDRIVTRCENPKWLGQACELVESYAKSYCPVRTGLLRGSITHEVRKMGKTTEGVIYTDTPYATYVEFGTGERGAEHHEGISPNVGVAWDTNYKHGQPAQPFMYPAIAHHRREVLNIANNGLDEDLKG